MDKTFECIRCGVVGSRRNSEQKYCCRCSGPASRELSREKDRIKREARLAKEKNGL